MMPQINDRLKEKRPFILKETPGKHYPEIGGFTYNGSDSNTNSLIKNQDVYRKHEYDNLI